MIIAMMDEFAQRMLTNPPTVARTSEGPIWLAARSPTRARDPRTEITRPKDVTVLNLACHGWGQAVIMQAVIGETVKPREFLTA